MVEIYPEPAQRVSTGQSVLFQCRVTKGIPSPTVSWSRTDGRRMESNVEVLDGGVLRINGVRGPERGEYLCQATNLAGTIKRIATLIVQDVPGNFVAFFLSVLMGKAGPYLSYIVITLNPTGSIQVEEGRPLRISCSAQADPAPKLTWVKLSPGGRADAGTPL